MEPVLYAFIYFLSITFLFPWFLLYPETRRWQRFPASSCLSSSSATRRLWRASSTCSAHESLAAYSSETTSTCRPLSRLTMVTHVKLPKAVTSQIITHVKLLKAVTSQIITHVKLLKAVTSQIITHVKLLKAVTSQIITHVKLLKAVTSQIITHVKLLKAVTSQIITHVKLLKAVTSWIITHVKLLKAVTSRIITHVKLSQNKPCQITAEWPMSNYCTNSFVFVLPG